MSPTMGFSWARAMTSVSVIKGRSRVLTAPVGGHHHLVVNPAVGFFETVAQANRRRPSELLLDQGVVAAAAADAFRRVELVTPLYAYSGDVLDDVYQLVDRHEF